MTTKLLITGDWQLDSAPAHDQVDPSTNRSTRFQETVDTIAKVLEAGRAAGATGLLHLGDLTENKKPEKVELDAAAGLFESWLRKDGRIWAIAGNHDGSLFEISSSSFAPLARMRPDQFTLFHKVAYDKTLNMLAIPYIHKATGEELAELIRQALPEGGAKGVFGAAHYGVEGCTVGTRNLVLQSDYLTGHQLASWELDFLACGHIHKGQRLKLGLIDVFLPGSPVICDQGEKLDSKTFGIFNTATRQLEVHEIPQRRRWLSIPYSPEIVTARNGDTPWGADDIVKVTGTYEKPDYPKATFEEGFKGGLIRPFSLEFDVKQAKSERAARSMEITAEGGLRQSLQTYVKEKFPNTSGEPGQVAPATAAALDVLNEQGGKVYTTNIWPTHIEIEGFMTFPSYKGSYAFGVATLVMGKNGIGKTNFFEAPLWCATGKTSKGLGLDGVVSQDGTKAQVTLFLQGLPAEDPSQRYRIIRSVKLSKDGKAAQKLSLDRGATAAEIEADHQGCKKRGGWIELSDGGVADVQAIINGLLGASYLSLKVTNFRFQRDNQNERSAFTDYAPQDRKKVIGEILGLEPLAKAFKVLDDKRKESTRAHEAGKSRLAGMVAAGEGQEERLATAKAAHAEAEQGLAVHQAGLAPAEAAVKAAQDTDTAAKAKVTDLQGQLDALPNTEAAVKAAEQGLATYKSTFEASNTAKRARYTELAEQIKSSEATLTGLQAPAPAEIQALEGQSAAAGHALEVLRTRVTAAQGELQGATAQAKASTEAVVLAEGELSKAETSLAAVPEAAPADTQTKLAAAQAQLEATKDKQKAATEKAGGLQTSKALAEAELKALAAKAEEVEASIKGFDGADIGSCSRCKQPIDSKHIEQELADLKTERLRIAADSLAATNKLEAIKAEATAAGQELITHHGSLAVLQKEIDALTTAQHQAELDAQKRAGLAAAVEDWRGRLTAAQAQATEKQAAAAALQPAADALAKEQAAAQLLVDQLAGQIKAKRDLANQVVSLRAQLQALQDQHAANTKAGIEEKSAFDKESARLQGVVDQAVKDHAGNQVLVQALRGQLDLVKADATRTGDALVQALLARQTVASDISAAEQRIKDLKATVDQIESQRTALENARFELKALEERAEIDTRAAELVDPKQGLPVFLIDQALPFLEDRINTYMEELGAAHLRVELTTLAEDKETLAVLIDNGRPGRKLDIANYSGGQLDRVEYAIKWALSDLQRQTRGVTFGMVCYDEPSGGLEADGKEQLIRMIHQRTDAFPVTMVISHDEALQRAFETRLQFTQGLADETLVAA